MYRVKELLETTMDFTAGAEIGHSINKIEDELKEDYNDDSNFEDKEVQTMPYIPLLTGIEKSASMRREISIDDSSPVKSFKESPKFSKFTVNLIVNWIEILCK